MGTPHLVKNRGSWPDTVWQLCSGTSRGTPLEEQFEAVARQLPAATLQKSGRLPEDARIYFSVGLFSDAQIPTADLSIRCLEISNAYGASVEVKVYMSDMQ